MMARFVAYAGFEEAVREAAIPRIEERAELALEYAQDIAPVRTGLYKSLLRVARRRGANRGTFQLQANAPYSRYLEFGTRNLDGSERMKAQRILLRASRIAKRGR